MKKVDWIDLKRQTPKKQQSVYIIFINPYKKKMQTIATWIPYMEVLEEDFMHEDFREEGDYDEINEEYYTPEGFYERCTQDEVGYKIQGEILFWHPLFEMP